MIITLTQVRLIFADRSVQDHIVCFYYSMGSTTVRLNDSSSLLHEIFVKETPELIKELLQTTKGT